MAIKYVVFGTGVRAERLHRLLGHDRIVAFIDNYPDKSSLFDIPVISLDDFKAQYNEYIIIVSPMIYEDIVLQLEKEGISYYLLYSDCPSELIYDIQTESNLCDIKERIIEVVKNKCMIRICGLTLYSLLLYEWLQEVGKEVVIDDGNVVARRRKELKKRLGGITLTDRSDKYDINIVCVKEWINSCEKELLNAFALNRLLEEYYDKRIEAFKNVHAGERCFIVATGPSLKLSDLDFLYEHKQISVSMNKVFYAFSETMWRPDYYLASDPLVTTPCKTEIMEIESRAKFIGDMDSEFWNDCSDDRTFRLHQTEGLAEEYRFSDDLSHGFERAHSTTFLSIQLAVYMGFKEIYLIGVDHSGGKQVNSPERHFYGDKDKKAFKMRFVPETLVGIEADYLEAKRYSKKRGIKIYNATRGGNLEVFERKSLDDLFDEIEKEE